MSKPSADRRFRSGIGRAIATAFFAACLLACGREPDGPEAQIRRLIAECEAAAEARDADPIQDRIAPEYDDGRGRDAQALRSYIGLQILRRQSIHLFTRIHRLELPAPGHANLLLYVAMGGTPIAGIEDLAGLETSLYRVELTLKAPPEEVAEGNADAWLVHSAEFRRAAIDDFR